MDPQFAASFRQKFPRANLNFNTMNTFDNRGNPINPFLIFTVDGIRFPETTPSLLEILERTGTLEEFLAAIATHVI